MAPSRRTRGISAASRALEIPFPSQSIPPLSVPSPLMEPRLSLADELSQAGAESLNDRLQVPSTMMPPTNAPMQFTLAEPKPMELEHLSTFSKLEELFHVP